MKRFVRHTLATGAGLALAMGGGAAVLAQSQSSSPQAQATPAQTQPQPKLEMVQARAELSKTLDAKKAKQGDVVDAKLTENVQIPNAQELPKNTVLEGHVDQVTASENKSNSTMVVTFDKAKLKDGQELPIKATVVGLSEPALAAQQDGGMAPGGGMAGGGAAAGGGAPAGGMARSGGSSAGMPSNESQSQPAMNPETAVAGSPQGQGGQASGGVPDVQLSSSIHQHASATLTSKGRNVHVPDGTQMQVAITVVPAGVRVP